MGGDPEGGFPSFFDPADPDGAGASDLWFQPDEPPQDRVPPRPTGPFDPAEWARAQADLSAELAALCFRFGALDARLAGLGAGVRQRLALREAVDVSWWASTRTAGGGHIDEERLSLWLGLRAGGGLDDSLALQEAAWAARRLTAPPSLGAHPDADSFHRFLGGAGLASDSVEDLGQTAQPKSRARGPLPTYDAANDLATLMQSVDFLHPVTQAAVLFHGWCALGPGGAVQIEAGVMAACYGARMSGHTGIKSGSNMPNRAFFLPLAMGGGFRFRSAMPGPAGSQGAISAVNRLSAWIEGAAQATLWALRLLDRMQAWQVRADGAVAKLSGRTPKALCEVFAAWPMVTAPLAQAQIGAQTDTGSSRAAVQRNLDLMQRMNLIREITGQGRYRIWTAKI